MQYNTIVYVFTLYMYKVLIKINFRDRARIELQVHSCSTTYGDSIFTIQDVKLSKNEYNYAKDVT